MSKLPAEVITKALDSHTAILGKTGSGKSNTAKWMSEQLMDREERVCAIDPTGTWWGMRLKPDGKPSKYKPIIFGGRHADIPILPEHGAAIAEAVATSNDSSIIDLREMTVGGRTKFFAAFAEALLRLNRGKLNLMLDEAHLFAPQGRVNDPQSGIMLNATNNLVSLGRGNGIRVTMISQRPAKLHKDSLTQCETLIAMRLIAPQDRSAINDWVGEWGDVSRGKEIIASLPSMPVGTAWLWAPEQNFLEKIDFPKVKTLDTGRQDDGNSHMLTLKIDIAEVTARLEGIAAEVIANDPKRLKTRIAELETALREAKAVPAGASAQALMDATDDGFTAGWDAGVKGGYKTGYQEACQKLGKMVLTFAGDFAMAADMPPEDKVILKGTTPGKTELRGATSAAASATTITEEGRVVKSPYVVTPAMQDSGITGPQGKILDALKIWQVLGHETPTRQMVAPFAGYSPTTKSFKNALSELRTAVRVDYENGGLKLLIDWNPISPADGFNAFRGQLSGPEKLIANALFARGGLGREDLATVTGYSPTTKSFKNAVSSLHTKTVVEYAGRGGAVSLTDWVHDLMQKFGEL